MFKFISTSLLICFLFIQNSAVVAGERDDIKACIEKLKEFAGLSPDPLEAKYTSHWTSPDEVFWPRESIYCTTTLDTVRSLSVGNKTYIVEFYAGKHALSLYNELDAKVEKEIDRLKNRLRQASQALKRKEPNLSEIEKFIDDGILSTATCNDKEA